MRSQRPSMRSQRPTIIALALTYHSRKDVVSRKVLTLVGKFLFLWR